MALTATPAQVPARDRVVPRAHPDAADPDTRRARAPVRCSACAVAYTLRAWARRVSVCLGAAASARWHACASRGTARWARRIACGLGAAVVVTAAVGQSSTVPRAPVLPPPPGGAWPSAGAAELTRGRATTAPVPAAGDTPGFGDGDPKLAPQAVVELFDAGCVAHEGEVQRVVDWAITAGMEPLDPATPNVQALLDGREGSILALPGTQGRVMIAAGSGRHCVVWTEQASGPALRLALLQVLAGRTAKGELVETEVDRKVERGGAWRQQTQWRYRRVGGSADYQIGAVTTLADRPAAQVLRLAPRPPSVGSGPDGTPLR